MVLEKILEYSLDCKEIKPFNPKGNQSKYSLKGLMLKFQCFGHLMQVKVKSLSRVWLFATPWIAAYQASPSVGFSRQGYWSGLPLPSPGDLPNPRIEPRSPTLQADVLPSETRKVPMQRVNLLEKTLMLGKTEGQRRKRWQDEMVEWHYWINGHEFEQTPDNGDRQGNLVCCSPWGHKKSDTTELLSNNNNFLQLAKINVSLS